METKFYDSTGTGQSNAMFASEKFMEELRKLGVLNSTKRMGTPSMRIRSNG